MNERPLFLTVLPKERRARHPYQLGAMLMILSVGLSMLTVGPAINSSLNLLPAGQIEYLAVCCIVAGCAGIAAAFIPERVMRFRKWEVEMTWMRLWVEFGCHGLLVFVGLSFGASIYMAFPFWQGVSLGLGAAMFFTGAGLTRCIQILWTIKKAVVDPPRDAAIVGAQTFDSGASGG